MDDHEQVTEYSRQEVIDAATDFYTFLTHLHVPDATLLIAPSTGWPDITAESHALFHKNDEVLELMRHLPYIERHNHSTAHPVYPLTAYVDYEGPYVRKKMAFAKRTNQELDLLFIEPDNEDEWIPLDVLCLANETCGADGCWFLLDTTDIRAFISLATPASGRLARHQCRKIHLA